MTGSNEDIFSFSAASRLVLLMTQTSSQEVMRALASQIRRPGNKTDDFPALGAELIGERIHPVTLSASRT